MPGHSACKSISPQEQHISCWCFHLVQAVAPAAPRHGPACELINDDDLVLLDDVVDVLDKQLLGLDGVDDVARPLGARVIQVGDLAVWRRLGGGWPVVGWEEARRSEGPGVWQVSSEARARARVAMTR